jgi:hypothetical protein
LIDIIGHWGKSDSDKLRTHEKRKLCEYLLTKLTFLFRMRRIFGCLHHF